jgi:signal peptidase I
MNDKRTNSDEDVAVRTMPNALFAELMAAVLAKGSSFRFAAAGFSMSPFIRNGDIITVIPPHKKIRFGDVVVFINPKNNKLTVHRVIHISRDGYLVQGDTNHASDGYITQTNILGRVICVEHRGRQTRFGLGIDRILIAFMSRRNWLVPFLAHYPLIRRIIMKRNVR